MKTATRHIMRIAAVLALTAASTSAFAQDDRRSFDDGYQAGQRAADERGEHRGPPGFLRVRVERADYGVRDRVCDARRAVSDEVERNHGAILVGNQLCGDPARGAQKTLSVTYRCGDSESVRVMAREQETLRLSCRH